MNYLRSFRRRRWGYLGSALGHRRRLTRPSRNGDSTIRYVERGT